MMPIIISPLYYQDNVEEESLGITSNVCVVIEITPLAASETQHTLFYGIGIAFNESFSHTFFQSSGSGGASIEEGFFWRT